MATTAKLISQVTESDYDGDGIINDRDIVSITYDADRNKLSEVHEADWGGDGTINLISKRTSYTYDANGNLISQIEEEDGDGNGIVDQQSITYTYDAKDNLISEIHESDRGADGTIEFRTTFNYSYDELGNLILSDFAETQYSFSHQTTSYTYNSNGNLIAKQTDYYSGIHMSEG